MPTSSMLKAMYERVLLPLTAHCTTKALNDFFVTNVSDITALLLSRFTKVRFILKYFETQITLITVAAFMVVSDYVYDKFSFLTLCTSANVVL